MKENENYKKLRSQGKSLLPNQILASLTMGIFLILSVYLISGMQTIIDGVVEGANVIELIEPYVLGILLLFILSFISQYFIRILSALANNKVLGVLYENLLDKDISFFQDKTTGELNSLIVNDGEAVASWMATGWVVRLLEIVAFISNLYLMISYSLFLTLIILGIIGICFIGISIIAKKLAEISEKSFEIKGDINQFLIESIQSINLIKPLRKEGYFSNKFNILVDEEKFKVDKRESGFLALYMALTVTLMYILPLVAVVIGAILAMQGKMTIGSIVGVYALTGNLQEPVRIIADSFNQEKTAMKLADRLALIIGLDNEYESLSKIDRFDGLSIDIDKFSYGDKDILKSIEFDIESDEIVVLKGESGSGKSTLANLIMGFLDIEDGSVKVSGKEVGGLEKDSLWKYLLNQGQEHLILEGSLYENLSLGDDYSHEEIERVIEVACLSDFVEEYGLNREFSEAGKNLSGGQRQRINLARILLRKPEFLILDEPTAALDSFTAESIVKNIVKFSKENEMSLMVISHRPDFDIYADNIIELKA